MQRVRCLPPSLVGCDAGRWRRAQRAVCGRQRAQDTARNAAARRDGAHRALMTIVTLGLVTLNEYYTLVTLVTLGALV